MCPVACGRDGVGTASRCSRRCCCCSARSTNGPIGGAAPRRLRSSSMHEPEYVHVECNLRSGRRRHGRVALQHLRGGRRGHVALQHPRAGRHRHVALQRVWGGRCGHAAHRLLWGTAAQAHRRAPRRGGGAPVGRCCHKGCSPIAALRQLRVQHALAMIHGGEDGGDDGPAAVAALQHGP